MTRRWLSVAALTIGGTFVLSGCSSAEAPPRAPMLETSALTPVGQWRFEEDRASALPAGSQPFNGTWAVRAEAGAPSGSNALCQTGNADFPGIMLDPTPRADLVMSARF